MDNDWIEHWINDLISEETVDSYTFEEWMWCPERYTEGELNWMADCWYMKRYRDK